MGEIVHRIKGQLPIIHHSLIIDKMPPQNATDFKSTKILYFALLTGQLLIAGVLFYLNYSSGSTIELSPNNTFRMVAIIALVLGNFGSYYLYNNAKRVGSKLKDFSSKEVHFRKSSAMRWALLEGPNMICLVLYFLTKDVLLLLLFAIGVGGFLMAMPSAKQFAEDYDLTNSEERALAEKE